MSEPLDIATASEMDLVNLVNETEGLAWRMNHDAAHGRISGEGIDDSIGELRGLRDQAVAEITKRTGISDLNQMREYIQKTLRQQDAMWDAQWADLSEEGAVFKIDGNESLVLETVRAYLPRRGTMGPNQYIFARTQGSLQFYRFDDRDIPKLTGLTGEDVSSLYLDSTPEARGLIRADEEPERRARGKLQDGLLWNQIDTWDRTVFRHAGFDEVFDAVDKYNFRDRELSPENEIVLARSHVRPVFVEFTPQDLGAMELLPGVPKLKVKHRYALIES